MMVTFNVVVANNADIRTDRSETGLFAKAFNITYYHKQMSRYNAVNSLNGFDRSASYDLC